MQREERLLSERGWLLIASVVWGTCGADWGCLGTLNRTLGGTLEVSRVLCGLLTGMLMVSRTLHEGLAVSWTLAGATQVILQDARGTPA